MSDIAVPVTYAAQHSDLIKPLISLPTLPERPLHKAIANLTTEPEALKPEVLGLTDNGSSQHSAGKRLPLKIATLVQDDFKAEDAVEITVNNPDKATFTTKVLDAEGKEQSVSIHTMTSGTTTELIIDTTNQFVPGKYTVEITDQAGQTIKQDFTWGVLAMNTDKSVYAPNETAAISLAVLDELGDMVCNADITLKIAKPDGSIDVLSTGNEQIKLNDECHSKAFTLKPDYETTYTVANAGEYKAELTAVTKNGTYTILDSFAVQDALAFDVKRTSATRIYPPLIYPVHMEITANEDFTGTVTETVPDSFTITPASEANSYDKMNTLYLDSQKDPAKKLHQHVLGSSDGTLVMPFDGVFQITQGFGTEMTDNSLRNFYSHYGLGGHDGVDFALPTGTPLYAVDNGNILVAGYGDYGITVIIQHSWGRSYYGHLSKVNVTSNTSVAKGSLIGYSGNTGESTGPHLHFGMKPETPDDNNGYAGKIDPLPFLPAQGTNTARALNLTHLEAVLAASTSAEENSHTSEQNLEHTSLTEPAIAPVEAAEPQITVTPSPAEQTVLSASNTASYPPIKDYTVHDDTIRKAVAYSTSPKIEKVKVIKWQVSLKKGEKTTLSYAYKAPQVSPQFYTVGPAKFFAKDSQKVIFAEKRTWQIAADSVGVDWYNKSWTNRKAVTVDSTKVGEVVDPWCDAGSSCNTSWESRMKITFDNSAATEDLTNFPVLVKLDSSNITLANIQADGDDLRFVDGSDHTAVLPYDIDNFDGGEEFIWVNVPQIDQGSTTDYIWLYYNNPSATAGNNPTATWNSGYSAIWHLEETGNGTAGEYADSTTNNNDGRGGNGTAANVPTRAASQISFGQDFDGSTDLISTTNTSIFTATSTYTTEAWINPDSCGESNGGSVMDKVSTTSMFLCQSTNNLALEYIANGSIAETTTNAISFDNWYHVAISYNGSGTATLYVNGVNTTSDSTVTEANASGVVVIGADAVGTTTYSFDGTIDEARISTTNRSTSWIYATYLTGTDAMNTYGAEETQDGPADDWCNDTSGIQCTTDWNSRTKITIDNSTSSSSLTDFPLLVVLNSSRINYDNVQSDGDDLRFVASGDPTTVIPHEIEGTWSSSGTNYVWVQVDLTTSASQYIWVYYSNASATSGVNATGVWDSNYQTVWHSSESTATLNDSAGTAQDGTKNGASNPLYTSSGQVNGAQDYNGTSDDVSASVTVGSTQTLEAWIRADSVSGIRGILTTSSSCGGLSTSGSNLLYLPNDGTNAQGVVVSSVVSTATWYRVVATYDGTTMRLYQNGTEIGNRSTGEVVPTGSTIEIGHCRTDPGRFWDGRIDEVRISDTTRSADWIEADYLAQTDTMNSFGSEELYEVTLTDYPVLINLSSDSDLVGKTQSDGDDILFTTSDGITKIPHEIESYNSGTGALVAWVKISSLTNLSDTDIYMYYGNPAATSQEDVTNVWDSSYKGVWHLEQDPAVAGASGILDSTSNNNDGTDNGSMNAADQVSGQINGSLDFEGTDDYIGIPHNATLEPTTITASIWVKFNTLNGGYDALFSKANAGGWDFTEDESGTSNSLNWEVYVSGVYHHAGVASSSLSNATWYNFTGTYDGETVRLYKNGVLVDSNTTPSGNITYGSSNSVIIGADAGTLTTPEAGTYFDGGLDEARISNSVRAASWIATEYNNQNSPSTFYTLGSEETYIYAPTNAELMRHGKFFDSRGSEQPFAY